MNIKQTITKGEIVFIFTDEPSKDIKELEIAYENRDDTEPEIPLGYEVPLLTTYTFLGKEYECISLWFDNEDIPDIYN